MMGHWVTLTACRTGLMVLMMALGACASNAPEPEEVTVRYQPEQSREWVCQGRQAYEAGRPEAALDAWRKALAADPTNAIVRNNLGLVLKELARFSEAAETFEEGLAVTPEVADMHYNLAVISELYLLDFTKALKHYRQFQDLSGGRDAQVAGWIADLERRLQ
ncbi:tetratricopeptide repeat protein [Marinobacter daepoensis]|uniref:Tetratricopeptide repeat protein n=1 Tax=Marinobacter daepoensis TaxID=262077 RepID=A0ABS3BAL6_9GAMM|nr:tetratricopeptide repeat protein [Marinobacter daepoensis]MBN7768909.1 tetratricopeptide repeat protein [Marinobacter daepoensis]MBY6077599.1 tetratricopeptide repeat protein [Marinobacter daepoensis]